MFPEHRHTAMNVIVGSGPHGEDCFIAFWYFEEVPLQDRTYTFDLMWYEPLLADHWKRIAEQDDNELFNWCFDRPRV